MTARDTRTGDRHDREKVGRLIRGKREMWDALDRRADREGIESTEAARQAIREWAKRA